MPLEKTLKTKTIADHAAKEGDTGSTAVQIAIFHARIQQITEHLKRNKNDKHSLRGLTILVGKRRRLEAYLRRNDIAAYRALIQKLGIREVKPR